MAYQLSQLRGRVQSKLNNVSTETGTIIFQPTEIDNNVNAGIKFVGHMGNIDLIQYNLYKATDLTVSAGKITKPSDFFRFNWAQVDGRRGRLLDPIEFDDFYNDPYREPNNTNKYLIDYDGTYFKVYPASASNVEFHYIAILTDLSSDTSVSPLTNVGDDYAIDWAFALCLESKGFKPELAQRVFNRVMMILGASEVKGSIGSARRPLHPVPTRPPGPVTDQG